MGDTAAGGAPRGRVWDRYIGAAGGGAGGGRDDGGAIVCGSVVQPSGSVLAPVRPLTSNIALEMDYARDDHRAALFVSGGVLLAMVCVLVGVSERMSRGDLRHTAEVSHG